MPCRHTIGARAAAARGASDCVHVAQVAAMLTRPFPLTAEKFKELSGGKEFMSMQYVVLEVRPAPLRCAAALLCAR